MSQRSSLSQARALPGTELLVAIQPGSKLLLYVDHSRVVLYEHDLEQSAVFDVGLLKKYRAPEWVLRLEKLFVPCDIFCCDYDWHALNPVPPDWDDDEGVAELVKQRGERLGLIIPLRPKTGREAVAEAMAGDWEPLTALASALVASGKKLSAETHRAMAEGRSRVLLTDQLGQRSNEPCDPSSSGSQSSCARRSACS